MGKLEDAVSKCKSLVELISLSKQLKESGEDVAYVNSAVSNRRRQLLREEKPATNLLEKKYVQMLAVPSTLETRINLRIDDKKSGKLVITENGEFVWE